MAGASETQGYEHKKFNKFRRANVTGEEKSMFAPEDMASTSASSSNSNSSDSGDSSYSYDRTNVVKQSARPLSELLQARILKPVPAQLPLRMMTRGSKQTIETANKENISPGSLMNALKRKRVRPCTDITPSEEKELEENAAKRRRENKQDGTLEVAPPSMDTVSKKIGSEIDPKFGVIVLPEAYKTEQSKISEKILSSAHVKRMLQRIGHPVTPITIIHEVPKDVDSEEHQAKAEQTSDKDEPSKMKDLNCSDGSIEISAPPKCFTSTPIAKKAHALQRRAEWVCKGKFKLTKDSTVAINGHKIPRQFAEVTASNGNTPSGAGFPTAGRIMFSPELNTSIQETITPLNGLRRINRDTTSKPKSADLTIDEEMITKTRPLTVLEMEEMAPECLELIKEGNVLNYIKFLAAKMREDCEELNDNKPYSENK